MKNPDQLCVNTLRFLSADMIQQANSGHPGLPLGAAPMAYVLWDRFIRHNPRNPQWFNRDRFILSAGHGSALMYSLLHMTGYDLPMDELRDFRQWDSKTPGHPEYGLTPGVDATTGPLGQGFAMGVGMALAERFLAATYNTDDCTLVEHYTYAIVSDGDLMEGIASEAASLAGTQKLGKLIYLYDDNCISIEGSTDLAFTEDVEARFRAYDWHVQRVEDGNDIEAIAQAIVAAQAETERPSLIMVKTQIGYGSPKQDQASAHGEPLGEEALAATRQKLGWPAEPRFHVPEEAARHMGTAVERGAQLEADWSGMVETYRSSHPDLAASFDTCISGQLPEDWDADVPAFSADGGDATRNSSGKVLNALAARLPNLIGGSADLAPSNKTWLDGHEASASSTPDGRNFHFGVREHAMGAIVNGMALHGGVIPYGGTFLVFADYMRPTLRMAALMETNSIFVFTHDSIGVGEDGPTHQPIEHLMSLRVIPGLTVMRPADANETAVAWKLALQCKGPIALALTRQKLPTLDAEKYGVEAGVARGAYILEDSAEPDLVIIATGSEVSLALDAGAQLSSLGIQTRVVSMPSWELFCQQPEEYRAHLLPPQVPKMAIEAGVTHGWHKFVGTDGVVIGLDDFGASAPGDLAMEKFGFSVENVVACARQLLGR